MVGWQDGFQRAVAAHFGLTRRGPGKRRLTRGAWKAEQEQARSLAQPVPAELTITPQDVTKNLGVSIPTLYRWVPASTHA